MPKRLIDQLREKKMDLDSIIENDNGQLETNELATMVSEASSLKDQIDDLYQESLNFSQ